MAQRTQKVRGGLWDRQIKVKSEYYGGGLDLGIEYTEIYDQEDIVTTNPLNHIETANPGYIVKSESDNLESQQAPIQKKPEIQILGISQ